MTYEVAESKNCAGEWRVEAINPEGEVYVTLFSGPIAKERAKEYAAWKVIQVDKATLVLT